jgi:hypothetical protein
LQKGCKLILVYDTKEVAEKSCRSFV